jgi:hypothetical protein
MPLDPALIALGGGLARAMTQAANKLSLAAGSRLGAASIEGPPPSPPAVGAALPPAAAPAADTMDLTLKEAIRRPLTPPAESLGLAFGETTLIGKFSRRAHRVTQLHDHAVSRTLLHLPKAMLSNPSRETLDALALLQFIFNESQTVYVFGEDVNVANWANQNILSNMWSMHAKLKGEFVPWDHVRGLPEMPLADQVEFMRTRFDLGELEARGPADLTFPELRGIIEVIVQFADFGDTRGRGALLMRAGIPQFTGSVDLQGVPETVALTLVFFLGRQPKPAADRAPLGKLLDALMRMPNLPPDRGQVLQALIDRSGL